jgi:hypothetical protein
MPEPSLHRMKLDAYLRWVLQTGFRYYDTRASGKTVLIVRFEKTLDDTSHKRLLGTGLWICPFYIGSICATVRADIDGLEQQLAELEDLGAVYCELGAPVAPPASHGSTEFTRNPGPGPATVIGIVDDGCPFAHHAYRRNDPSAPRVRYIWDQGDTSGAGGLPPLPFNYGRGYDDGMLQAILASATVNGTVDEDTAYGLTALPSLRGAVSHGAQVMSHAAGAARPIEGRAPPAPLSGRTDIVFVQLAPESLDDPSGQWLDYRGLDALQAIRFYAREAYATPAQTVVVNLSYGPQTGPHDGSSNLERKIDEMTADAAAEGYAFHVVVPSGNNHLLRAHAQFDLDRGGGSIDWFVAADSQLPSLLEIWLPAGVTLDHVVVALDTPWGEHIEAGEDKPAAAEPRPVDVIVSEGPSPAHATHVVMAVAPTARSTDAGAPTFPLAPPGRWRVSVQPRAGQTPHGIAHAYLARSTANMGRARRGRSGWLYSPGYQTALSRPPDDEQLDGSREPGPAEVVARGAMSGIATGSRARVAAGFRLRDRLPAPYSGGGPSRGARTGPDFAYPTDESRVLPGLLAAGNRSGTVMRLSGTSIAAPQYARALAATPVGNFPAPPGPVPPPPPWLADRAGRGLR